MPKKTDVELQNELLEKISEACEQLGWSMVVPALDPDQPANGVILGSDEFLEYILTPFQAEIEVAVDSKGNLIDPEDLGFKINKKKETLH